MREKQSEYKNKKIEKAAKYITIAAIFLIPIFSLITTSYLPFPFITGKAFFFRILVEIAFAGWIILAFLNAKYRPKLTPLTITVSLFAIITLVADLFGVDPIHSIWSDLERMEGWITIIHLWAFYMVITNVFGSEDEEKRIWHMWLNVSLSVATIVAIGGLCQMFGLADFHNVFRRADAFLGNSEYMAVYMLFHIFISAYLFIVAWKKKVKGVRSYLWIYPVIFILFVSVLLGTQTRGAILGLIGGVMLALALYALLGKGESSKWRWVSGGIIVLIFMTGGIFWLNRGSSLVKHNPLLNRFASISLSDASNQSRLYIWPMAWKGGMEHPVLGWGQENFSYIFQARYNPAMYSQEKWFDRAHNVFLDWFVSAGFIGLAAYLALYFLSIFHVWRSSLSIKEKIVLIGMIAAYAIHSMFVFDNIASYIIFFFLLGYVGSLKSGVLVKPHGDVAPSAKALHPDTVKYSLLPIVTVVLLVTVYYLNIRPIITGTNLILAVDSCPKDDPDAPLFQSVLGAGMNWMDRETDEEMFSCAIRSSGEPAVSSEAKKAIIDLADSETKKPRITAHDDARSDFDEGAFLDQVGLTSEAQSLLERAHDLSPAKQDISFELAADYLYQSKDEEAVSILKQAYESATQYSTAASAYAVALVIDGKGDEARKIPGVDAALLDRVESYGKDHLKPIIAYQGVIVDQSDFTLLVQQSRREYAAGMNDQAVQTLQHVENIYPEYKDLMESAISQIRKSSSQSL